MRQERNQSARERRIALYKNDQQQPSNPVRNSPHGLCRAQELCESRGGRPGPRNELRFPNKPHDFCGRKATLNRTVQVNLLTASRPCSVTGIHLVRTQVLTIKTRLPKGQQGGFEEDGVPVLSLACSSDCLFTGKPAAAASR